MRLASHSLSAERHAQRGAGFTLIELVLSLAACAILMAAIYSVFSKAIHLRNEATERTRLSRIRARAESVLRNDLKNARVSGGTLAATLVGSREPDSKSGRQSNFPGYLKFTTTTATDNGELEYVNGELLQVEYYIANDPNSATDLKSGILVRTTDQALLATTRTDPPEQTLLAGVDSMELSFYDGQTWRDTWTVTEAETDKTLPQAVRVTIHLATAGDRIQPPIEVVVPWTTQPAIVVPAATETPTPP
ncbi:MAG: hypothetical protein JWL59_719 [Chthoniobacteraceae bacterium]|nr:hypothetical protein [Chthoniobacteraceae bacterium]